MLKYVLLIFISCWNVDEHIETIIVLRDSEPSILLLDSSVTEFKYCPKMVEISKCSSSRVFLALEHGSLRISVPEDRVFVSDGIPKDSFNNNFGDSS